MIPIRRIPLKLLFIRFPKIFNATIHQISIYRADVFFAQTTDNTFSRAALLCAAGGRYSRA